MTTLSIISNAWLFTRFHVIGLGEICHSIINNFSRVDSRLKIVFEDAEFWLLKIRTHLLIRCCILTWYRKAANILRGEASMSFRYMLAGVRLSVLLGLPAHTQAIRINFFSLIETHSIIFWTYWSSVMHILIILFMKFLPSGLSFSLFLYWSLCPHSWYQSHFLQVHFKGIGASGVSLTGKQHWLSPLSLQCRFT